MENEHQDIQLQCDCGHQFLLNPDCGDIYLSQFDKHLEWVGIVCPACGDKWVLVSQLDVVAADPGYYCDVHKEPFANRETIETFFILNGHLPRRSKEWHEWSRGLIKEFRDELEMLEFELDLTQKPST